MKKIYLLVIYCALHQLSFGQINISGSSSSYNYSTLKTAFDAINAGTVTGNITISISGSTTENSAASLNASGSGAANYSAILITASSASSINFNVSSTAITFNGSDKVTIDGKRQLTIINNNAGGNVLSFINDATNNQIKNTILRGTTTSPNSGVVFLGTGISSGNDNNVFDGCDIDGSSLATYCIHSSGSLNTPDIENSSDSILNCNIYNNRLNGGNTAGLFLNYGSTSWIVSKNSIYQTSAVTTNTKGIYYGILALPQYGTDSHKISDNFIGGNSPNAMGAMTLSSSTNVIGFIGMDIETGGANNIIQNNTLKNVSLTYSSTSEGFQNCGLFSYLSAFNGSTLISGNTISNFNFINNSGLISLQGISCTIQAADFDAFKDTFNVRNNIISNITGNSGGKGDVQLYGIRLNSNSSPNLNNYPIIKPVFNVSGNKVTDLSAPFDGANTYIRGISNLNNIELFSNVTINPTYNVEGNTVSNLNTNSTLASYTSGVIEGIKLSGGQGGGTVPISFISKNIINNLAGNFSGNSGTSVIGIYTSNSSYIIEKNKISGLTNKAIATSVTPYVIGIHIRSSVISTSVENNFISLGSSINNDINLIGILNSYSTDSVKVSFNSIIIAGNSSAGNKLYSAAFSKSSGSTDDVNTQMNIRNNIFLNTRSNGSLNFAIYSNNSTGYSSNYNDLYTANASTLAFFNNTVKDFAGYNSISKQDGNSINTNVNFKDVVNGDLHLVNPTQSLKVGITINGITTDIDSKQRDASTPFIGADEFGASIITIISNDFLTVFPNPARSTLYVHINGTSPGIAIISMSNSVAQKVAYNSVRVGASGTTTPINVSGFSKGVYFVRVELNGTIVTKKIIKI